MKSTVNVRHFEQRDLPALNNIYNHYINNTAITFDIEPKTLEDRANWVKQFGRTGRYQCFVATEGPRFLGWACSGLFRSKAAYQTSVEVSVYLHPEASGQGVGTCLYDALFDALENKDVHRALAGITQPNEASVALHRRFGFRDVGLYSDVGRKFGKYWDVLWMEKHL